MPASKEHRLFKRLLPFLIGISLFAFAVLPAEANAGFFDSILGTSKSPYKGATPTPKPSPKVKSVAQKQKSPRPQVAKKIDLPSIQLPKLNIGRTLASIGDALWPFDDVKATKTVAKKEFGGKQVGQVLGEKDSKGPGLLSKFFKGVGNVVAGVLDFLWPFDGDDKKGLAKKDGKGKAAVSPSPAGVTQPKAGDEVVTELAQTGEEDSSSALVAIPEEVAKLTITEKLTVGDDSSDRLILKALLGSDILVDTTKTYNLGSGSGRFKDGYFSNNIYVGEENRIGATGMNVKGPMYLETRSGGSLYLLPDSQNVYIGTDTQTGHLTVANNLTVKGTLSTTSGASLTPDSLDITPATNIDALDIIGTNITTASLIDLDPTGTTSGNIIDIDTSTAHSGHVISVDNTGNAIWTGNIIDVDTGTGDASGDVINIAIEAGATDVQGIVMTNAAATDQAGWLASVDASAAWTANAINFLQSAGISTGDVLAYDNTGNTATTGDFISFASGTGDADGDVFDITVELGATSTQIFDVNNAAVSDEAGWLMEVDTTGAWTGNAVDITTGAQAWTGNVVDINFGNAAATGDVVNIDIPALAVAVQNLVVTNAAASSTAGWLASVAASGAWTANAINFDQTAGISTADVLAYDNTGNTATTGDFISFASGTGDADGDVFDITVELGATSTQIFDVNNAAVSDEAGWLMEVDTTGAWTGNMIDITTGAQIWTANMIDINVGAAAATGDIINIALGADAPAVQALVVTGSSSTATGGVVSLAVNTAAAQSADIIDITSTVGIMDGSDTFQGIDVNITGANHTGASNVINGIAVDLTTPDADATETGVNIGANWDVGLSSATPVSFGGSMDVSTQDTFTDSDATPDVSGGSHFITNTTAVTITDFDAGAGTLRTGQVIFVESAGVITYDVTASGLNGGTTDLVTGAGDMTTWVYDGTDWNLTAWMDDSVIQAGGADLAEYFASHEILEPGDVVSADLANSGYVLKTAKAYESNLLGVVSTMPGLILGDPNDINQIALTGRVSVKVTNENGAIKAGDYLTSSSKAGYAMKATKAGPVVGMALADFDGQEGTVVTFVKATWFDPVEIQKQAVLAALGMGTYSSVYGGSVLGASTEAGSADSTGAAAGASSLIGPAADGSLGVLAEEVDLLVHGLLTASNLKVTTAAEFEGTLVVRGLATFEGDLVVKGALSLGSLDIAGALTKTMTAGSDLSAGDPVVISGANTVVRAGAGANVVGLAAHSAGAGSSVRVAVAGSVGGYSGLATGARYYVGPGGVVTTAPGGDRAVHIGIAISGSEMIVQIFEAAAPPAPPVVDTATVDPGPTVTVDSGSGGSGGSTSDTSSSPTSESSPTPTPEPSPVPESSPVPSPEPSVAPSPVPSGEPTPSPAP